MQSTSSQWTGRGEAWKTATSGERGEDSFSATTSHKEPSRRSARKSSGRRDRGHRKKTTASSADPQPLHGYSRMGNGSLSTSSRTNGVTSENGGLTSQRRTSGGVHAGKKASLGVRMWRAVWRPTFLYCAGVPMLVPSAILTGILFAFQPFSALHAIALVLLLLSLALIGLASSLLCWTYRHRPPSGKQLRKFARLNKDARSDVNITMATPRASRVTSERGGSSDATQPTSSLYADVDTSSRSRKNKHKKNKRHSKAAIPQLGRITESVQEEETPQPNHAASAWGEKPPRPPSTRRGHRPPTESVPPPSQSQLVPLICLPRARTDTPDSVVEEAKWQNVVGTPESGARLSRRHSLPDLTDDKQMLVQEYIQHLAAMETTPDTPEGTLKMELSPSNSSHSEKKKRGHQRSKSHGKMTSGSFVVDFGPPKPEPSSSKFHDSGPL